MTNPYTKYENLVINCGQENGGNHLVFRQTDRLTKGPTLAKQYNPSATGVIKSAMLYAPIAILGMVGAVTFTFELAV